MTPHRYVSLSILILFLIILGGTFYQFLAPFLLPLFLAVILSIICQPFHAWVLVRCGGRSALAAGVTTVALMGVILIPALIGTVVAATQLLEFAQTYLSEASLGASEIWRLVRPLWEHLAQWDPDFTEDNVRQEVARSAQQLAKQLAGTTWAWASSTVGAVVSLTIALGMFLVALYYFLADGPQLLLAVERLLPVQVEYQRQLWGEFTKATRAIVVATFLAAFAQGIATALALQWLGFGHFLVFFFLASITALIPIAGTWMVWGPCAILLAVQGQWFSAVGLTIWGMVVVGLIDNVVRTYILHTDAELHPLLAFVSVLGALQVLGLWGVFIGPIVACCLSGLVRILRQELNELLTEKPAALVHPSAQPTLFDAQPMWSAPSAAAQPAPSSAETGQ